MNYTDFGVMLPNQPQSATLPTQVAVPVVRFVVVPVRPVNRAAETLLREDAVREVCQALNRWAYEA